MHNRSVPSRMRGFVPLAACVVAVLGVRAGAQLQLEPPPLPAKHFNQPIAAVEKQIARAIERLGDAPRGQALVLEAQKNLRVIGRELLVGARQAHAQDKPYAVAMLYGQTILDAADPFDQMTDALPAAVEAALSAQPRDAAKLARLRQATDGLKSFNALAADKTLALRSTEAADVDAYVQRVLAPLAATAEALGGERPVSTWVAAGAADDGVAVTTERNLDALAKRLAAAPLRDATRHELRRMLQMMRRGLARPQFRARVAAFAGELGRLIDVAEAFAAADWLGEAGRKRFAEQAHTAVLLYKDPQTRGAGQQRIDRLARMRRLLVLMNDLSKLEDLPIDKLRGVFVAAQRFAGDDQNQAAADQLVRTLEQIAEAIGLQRTADDPRLPIDVRRVKQVLRRSYVAQERQLFDALEELAADPKAAGTPRWTARVAQLHDLGLQVHYLDQIPGWVSRMAKFNPRSARGLYKQLRLIAEDLLAPAANAGAAAALAEMERQLSLFDQLPHEQAITGGEKGYAAVLADRGGPIAQQLETLRSAWAAAWGAGADPTPAGRKLLLMRRLFVALHDATALRAHRARLAKLNRWAGWRLPVGAIAPMLNRLPDQLRAATGHAAAGEFEALERTLDQIDTQSPALWLAWRLAGAMRQSVERTPPAVAGMLSRCLYGPTAGALGADQRAELAEVCLYLQAGDALRRAGKSDPAQRLIDYAGQLARSVLRQLNDGDGQRPGGTRPVGPIDI